MDGSNWGNNPKVTIVYCCCLGAKMYLTLFRPMDCNPPGSSVRGFLRQQYWSGLPFPPPGDLSRISD